jgi:hypothetical protein
MRKRRWERHLPPRDGRSNHELAALIAADERREFGRAPSGDRNLRATAATRGRTARCFPGAVIAQIGDLRTATRISKGDAQRRSLVIAYFLAALVANEHCSPSHGIASLEGILFINSLDKTPPLPPSCF